MFEQLVKNSILTEVEKQKAQALLQSPGFPTKKHEDWKYTSLKSWLERDYSLASAVGSEIKVSSTDTYPLVLVNGKFQERLSVVPKGLRIQTTQDVLDLPDAFAAVGRLTMPEIVEIHVDKDQSFDRPLEIIFISASRASEAVASAQVHLHLQPNASVAVIENHLQHGSGTFFIYQQTKIFASQNNQVEFVQLQNVGPLSFHMARLQVRSHKDSQIKTCVVSLGALQSRSEVNFDFLHAGATAEVLGIYALNGTQQSDHYTHIHHQVGECQSSQLYKGLLDGKSKAVFVGGVEIAKDAQKANSDQLNKNLLLSSTAEVNSKPQLRIYADDVKAAHGSTIGQLQKEELFYLQSRAISKDKALGILSKAFVNDVVLRLDHPVLRDHTLIALDEKLKLMKGAIQS